MTKILVVHSSVRQNRISDKIYETVSSELEKHPELEVSVADFRSAPLPFFDDSITPSSPDFAPEDANVQAWTQAVSGADAVLILTAEYNHSYTAVLKNAIDWLPASAVEDKPFTFVGYGWAGGARATTNLRNLLTDFLKAVPVETEANLRFTTDIDLDGNVLDADSVSKSIGAVVNALK